MHNQEERLRVSIEKKRQKMYHALSMAAALMMSQFTTTGGTHVYAQEESAQSQDEYGTEAGIEEAEEGDAKAVDSVEEDKEQENSKVKMKVRQIP